MIFSIIGSILLLIPLYIGVNEVMSYYSLTFYRHQNISTIYAPFLGLFSMFIKKSKKVDDNSGLRRLFKSAVDKDLLVMNYPNSSTCLVFLTAPKMIRNFLLKELEISKKKAILEHIDSGFIDHSGPLAMKRRILFKQFLHKDNIQKIIPLIYKLINSNLDQYLTQNWTSPTKFGPKKSQEFKQLRYSDQLSEFFGDFVDLIILNDPASSKLRINGDRIAVVIAKISLYLREAKKSLLNIFSMQSVFKFGLHPKVFKARSLHKKMSSELWKIFENKKEEYITRKIEGKLEDRDVNIMDIIIEDHINSIESEKWTKEDIISHIMLIQIAGAETTLNLVKTFLDFVSRTPELKKTLEDEFNRIKREAEQVRGDKEGNDFYIGKILEDQKFDDITQEVLRMFGPAPVSTRRYLTKNVKIEGYKLRKGDVVFFPLSVANDSEKVNSNPEKFEVGRMTAEKRKQMDPLRFIPFSTGKRACIGNHLAIILFKIVVFTTFEKMEIDEAVGVERRMVISSAYGLEDLYLRMRPRSR